MSNNLASRQRWVDALKGITACLVVLVHVMEGFEKSGFVYNNVAEINISRGISVFHMPLFMAISGYVFALAYLPSFSNWGGVEIQIEKDKQYKSQIYNLMAMYFIFSILMFGFKYIFRRYVNDLLTWVDLIKLPVKDLPVTPYWYLYVLSIIYILAAFILKYRWNKNLIIIISLAICLLYQVLQVKEVITIQRVFYYFFFFMLGCMFKINGHSLVKGHYLLQCIIAVVMENAILFLDSNLHGLIIGILQVAVSVIVINVSFDIVRKYLNHKSVFSFIGEKSLEVYVLHVYITSGIRPALKILHIGSYWFAVAVTAFLGIALPIAFSYGLKKVKLWNLCFKPVTYFASKRAKCQAM